jgi:branched-chain amino acid aminotransferase
MEIVWLDGTLIATADARIDPSDRGLTLGDGLFETILVRGGQGRRLPAHWTRLRQGAALLGLTVPVDDAALSEAVTAVAAANGLTDAAVRLTLTAGSGPRGLLRPETLRPTLLLTAAPLPTPPFGPVRLVLAEGTRRNEHSPLSRIKSLNYLDSILARREAVERGADDAILLNSQGRLAEASAANLFLQLDGVWVTPPVAEGALPGTARAALIEAWQAEERPLTVAELSRATAIILSSALSLRPAAVQSDQVRRD